MYIILPIIFFILTWMLFYQSQIGWRESYLKSSITSAVFTVVLTESLSLFHALTPVAVTLMWFTGSLSVGGLLWKNKRSNSFSIQNKIADFSSIEKLITIGFLSIAFIVGFITVYCAPNTWDSMTYHLSRVEHWIQNRSLAPYPTQITRQLAYCPFAEYGLLQTMILTGTDRFVNFIQFFSMIGSWIVISLIAAVLGADRRGQLLTVLLAATIPMGILQGSSTQTDYVAAFWICAFVYSVLVWGKEFSLGKGMWAGSILGLAWLTKGYTYVYTFPFLLALFFKAVYPWKNSKLKFFVFILLTAIVLNVGYWERNWQSSGSLFGNAEITANTQWKVLGVVANTLRNMCSHLGTPSNALNKELDQFFVKVVSSMDSSKQVHEFHVPPMASDEDYTGNLLHLILGFVTLIVWLLFYRKDRLLKWYAIGLAAIVITFSLTIKWNAYISRYHLAFFLLTCGWMGVVWSRIKATQAVTILSLAVYLAAQPWLWNGNPRRIVSQKSFLKETRMQQYFIKRQELYLPYEKFSEGIQTMGCRQIGLQMASNDEWEYPWWVFLKQGGYSFRMEQVGAPNQANISYPLGEFVPCAVLGTEVKNTLVYGDITYSKVISASGWGVFVRRPL